MIISSEPSVARSTPRLTDWYPGSIEPDWSGWYEVRYTRISRETLMQEPRLEVWFFGKAPSFPWWSGKDGKPDCLPFEDFKQIIEWRGLTAPPEQGYEYPIETSNKKFEELRVQRAFKDPHGVRWFRGWHRKKYKWLDYLIFGDQVSAEIHSMYELPSRIYIRGKQMQIPSLECYH